VVGWIGTQGGPGTAPAGAVIAKNPTLVQPVAHKPAAPAAHEVQEYLSAHRQIPSAELYRKVNNPSPPAR
jgi:hypothetical protein